MSINAAKHDGRNSCDGESISRVHNQGEGSVDVGVSIDGTRHDLEAFHHRPSRRVGNRERDKNLYMKERVNKAT